MGAVDPRRLLCGVMVVAVCVVSGSSPRAQQSPTPVFRNSTELVLVNVVVRDKSGAVVRNLTRDDFSLAEDDRPQTITSFDFEELDKLDANANPREEPQAILPPKPGARAADVIASTAPAPAKVDMHGRRLIVLFFDLSSMEPEEVTRSVKAAHD